MNYKDELLLFDVNETLLDLRALQPHFEQTFGDGSITAEWFGLMLRLSLVATITRTYRPFSELGREALITTAHKRQVSLDSAVIETILGQMLQLPPHPDVVPALTRLKTAGIRMAALTNSAPPALEAQMAHASLTDFFEKRMSVEAVYLFKPAPETYQNAASQLNVPIEQVRMVAAHDWDVTGAIRAGAQAAFIARKGMVLGSSSETPNIIVPDLMALADKILE